MVKTIVFSYGEYTKLYIWLVFEKPPLKNDGVRQLG